MPQQDNIKIGMIGLGYVGLPLAVEFGKIIPIVGFDVSAKRINELKAGKDSSLEVEKKNISHASQLTFTSNTQDLADCNVYIIAVPTPIDNHNRPDLTALKHASHTVGFVLSEGNVVIYESTVYPGATEEICIPLLEQSSGLSFNKDFFAGYSPERINPGDKDRQVANILKVTAGSTVEAADFVDALYKRVIAAGTYKASSIKVAEAAKVIENTQRDVNIGLINELTQIFNLLGIDTEEVLEAAGTKWNFLPFRPGLVGGHCIGVDPFYLVHKAREVGYTPTIIPASRALNDRMGQYVAQRVIRLMAQRRNSIVDAKILILGLTFKENCPDLRNTRVMDIIAELKVYHAMISVYDPWVDQEQALRAYGIQLEQTLTDNTFDAIIIAVAHDEFRAMGIEKIKSLGKPSAVIFDTKYLFSADKTDGRL
ncbi:MAG: nucleotide sugar dehydrogenase [Chromatiales bacterium]|nr:nucleotide sugar dehydrogenase [Chromatiales bacterium]